MVAALIMLVLGFIALADEILCGGWRLSSTTPEAVF